jgi:hypothetical protein
MFRSPRVARLEGYKLDFNYFSKGQSMLFIGNITKNTVQWHTFEPQK